MLTPSQSTSGLRFLPPPISSPPAPSHCTLLSWLLAFEAAVSLASLRGEVTTRLIIWAAFWLDVPVVLAVPGLAAARQFF